MRLCLMEINEKSCFMTVKVITENNRNLMYSKIKEPLQNFGYLRDSSFSADAITVRRAFLHRFTCARVLVQVRKGVSAPSLADEDC